MKKEKTFKNTSFDALNVYLKEIEQYSLLTVEEEQELAKLLQSGDEQLVARSAAALVNSNLRLVVKIAHEYRDNGLSLLDLIEEGNLGLMRAALLYKPDTGAKFSTYSAWWIKQYMRRAIQNQSRTVRIPIQTLQRLRKIYETESRLKGILDRIPTAAEIADAAGMDDSIVKKTVNSNVFTVSIHSSIKEGENDTLSELLPDNSIKSPDAAIGDTDTYKLLSESFKTLDPREQQVLQMRFFQGKTLEEISYTIGRTRERVRQIQNDGLLKLRLLMRDEISAVAS